MRHMEAVWAEKGVKAVKTSLEFSYLLLNLNLPQPTSSKLNPRDVWWGFKRQTKLSSSVWLMGYYIGFTQAITYVPLTPHRSRDGDM